MTSRDTKSGRYTAILVQEHRHLAGELRKLGLTCDRTEITVIADRLRAMLAGHFAREEAPGGLRAAVTRSAPDMRDDLDDIMAEHSALIELVQELHAQSTASDAADEAIVSLAATLVCRLRDHEQRESSLLTAALWGGAPA